MMRSLTTNAVWVAAENGFSGTKQWGILLEFWQSALAGRHRFLQIDVGNFQDALSCKGILISSSQRNIKAWNFLHL
jgi:hypothetical protein